MANTTQPAPHPLDVKDKPEPPKMMFACIDNKRGMTFCNRTPAGGEFTFSSSAAKHVVEHYDPRTMKRSAALRLTGCIACIDNAKELLAKEGTSRLA